MIACPNKSTKEWKSLSKDLGEDRALLSFIRNKGVMPSLAEARNLITNKGLLESLQNLPTQTEDSVINTLKTNNLITGEPYMEDGKAYYQLVQSDDMGDKLGEFTTEYGTVLDYKGSDYVAVNPESIEIWNRIASLQKLSNTSVTQLARNFLQRVGVPVSVQDDVISKYGSNGVADFAEMMVRIQSGMEDQALPEEALHFFLDMIPQDHPALIEALDKVRSSQIYKDTVEKYKNNPNYRVDGQVNFTKIKKEALAKYLANEMKQKEKSGWIADIIKAIIAWIKGVKIKKDAMEILQDMFFSEDISQLNTNLQSSEMYNQLSDDQKAFYEAQTQTEEQKQTLNKLVAFSANTTFNEETHTYTFATPAGNKDVTKSATRVLGSDFYSEMENHDTMMAVINTFESVFPSVTDFADDDATRASKLTNHVVDLIGKGLLTQEDLEDTVGKRIGTLLFKASEAKQKTLFGTAIHAIAEAVILGKELDLDMLMKSTKPEFVALSKMISRKQLEKLIYGSVNEPGLLGRIRAMKERGSVIVPELEMSNGEIGAKFDILEIKKDGVVEIHDFKTKFLKNFGDAPFIKEKLLDEHKSAINTQSAAGVKDEPETLNELIGKKRSALQKYSQQLSIYKKMLMEAGVPVGGLHIIGIPYRLNPETKQVSEIDNVLIDNIPYDEDIADYYFNYDKALDASVKKEEVLKEDVRIKNIEEIKKDSLKEALAKALAKVTQLYKKYGKSKNVDELYALLTDETSKSNRLQLQKNQLESTLQNFDDVANFMTIQQNFLDVIDSSADMVDTAIKRFNDLKKLTPTDREGASKKLNELMKVKDFLMGYQSMFEELLGYMDQAAPDNPVVNKLNQLVGLTKGVRENYIATITPIIAEMLGDSFNKDLLDTIKREYSEMIAAAKLRGDVKREQELRKERDNLPTFKVIQETLKGNNGDAGWFFSKLMATASNPDIILAGVAKRLKATLDRVRLKNKTFRDELGRELKKRFELYGRGPVIKNMNESLVDVVEEFNPESGETMQVLYFKSEFDEKLYNDHAKLQYELKQAMEAKDKEKTSEARKKIKDFEQKYFQTGLTDEYYRLTKPLDTTVMYQGKKMTVREITSDLYTQISNIERLYTEDDINTGKLDNEHLKELQSLYERKAELREKLDEYGNPKTGDALKIVEALTEYDKNRNKLYDYVEQNEYFNRAKEKAKLQYGEGSEQYEKWLANNTRIVISDDYYKEREALFAERAALVGEQSTEISDLYKELSTITAPYKDKDGNVRGSIISEETADKIKELQDKINILQQGQEDIYSRGFTTEENARMKVLRYRRDNNLLTDEDRLEMSVIMRSANERLELRMAKDPDFLAKRNRIKQINSLLFAMTKKQNTKYYYDELAKQERLFAETNNITVSQLKKDREYYTKFKESKWYRQNHIIDTVVLSEDEETGERREVTSETPTAQWKRSMPVEKYILEKPANHFTKTVLKEYYEENGKKVYLQDKDNLDVKGRFKPKTNDQYKAENGGKEHPYLNKDFVNLRNKYNSKTASQKEVVDYENLLYIQKQMLESQENIEVNQRLGLAVPFLEKRTFERTVESGGQNLVDKAKNIAEGIKRSVTRTDQDVDQEGVPADDNTVVDKLATMDNNQVKFIPVRFSKKGDAANASYDVWGGVLNYVASINRKSELEKELAFVNGVEEILGQEANQPKSEERNMVLNNIYKTYIPELTAKLNAGGNTRLEVLKSFVNSVMYNEDYFKGYDILGLNTQKAISTVMGLTSFTILGAAPFNWAVNWISGNIQNIVESSGGRNYSFSDFTSAHADIYAGGKYGSAIKDMKEDYTKVGNLSFWGQMMEYFDPLQGEFENEFGHKTSWNGVKNIFQMGVFAGKIWGEWEIQMKSFIAFMKNHKVYNGKVMDKETFITQKLGVDLDDMALSEINAKRLAALQEWDKLDTNLLDLFEQNKEGTLVVKDKYKDVFQLGSSEFSDIVAKLHAMQKKMNGSYNKFDKTYAEKTSIGRMMFFFRKYFIPIGMARWGQRRVDYESMSPEQGFYLTFLQTVGKDLTKFRFNVVKNWHTYSPKEKEAIKKTLTDVGIVLSCVLAYSLLFGYDPDDKDRMKKLREKGWASQAAVFLLLKIKSETEQFMPMSGVQEVNRVYTNPSLIFSETTQYIKIANLTAMHLGNALPGLNFDSNLYYQKKASDATFLGMTLKDEGDSKLVAQMMKTFVGYTGKTFNPIEAIKLYEYSNTQNFK